MATVRFIGVPNEDHKSITQYGVTFELGKAVDAGKLGRAELRKLKNHPHFEVQDDVEDAKVRGEVRGEPRTKQEDLLKQAQALDLQVDGRWSEGRLAAEVERAEIAAKAR